MKNIPFNVIDTLRAATENGCAFMSFVYLSKKTQETSKYLINFGIDYRKACEIDKEALEAYEPQNDLEIQAKAEMLKSLTETLTEGVSRSYTQADTFENIGKGIKQHKETGEIYIYGFIQNKEVISEAAEPKKEVKSRPLTLAKKAIEKACDFKRNKFGQFILSPEHIGGIKTQGEIIEVHNN